MPRQCISKRNKNIKEREKKQSGNIFTKIRKQLSENVQLQLKFDTQQQQWLLSISATRTEGDGFRDKYNFNYVVNK